MLFCNNAFFLKCSKRTGAYFHTDFLAIDNKRLLLKVRLPDFLGVALRKANIVAELLSFATNFTCFHTYSFG